MLREAASLADEVASPEWQYAIAWGMLNLGKPDPHEVLRIAAKFETASRQGVTTFNHAHFLHSAITALLSSGERSRAERLVDELAALATNTDHRVAELLLENVSGLMLALDGRLEEAAARQMALPEIHIAFWLGRPTPPQGQLATSDGLVARSAHALQVAIGGDTENASAQLMDILQCVSHEVEKQTTDAHLLCLLHTAVITKQEIPARRVLNVLASRSLDLGLAPGFGTWFQVERVMGEGAALLRRPAHARAYFENAIGTCRLVGHRPELALSRLGLAQILLDHYPDECDVAIEHLDFTIAEFLDMKMQPALERALGRRGLLKS